MDFKQSNIDPGLYYLTFNDERAFIAIYVDDILVMSTSDDILNNALDLFEEHFKIKRLGAVSWTLSLHVTQSPHYIALDQSNTSERYNTSMVWMIAALQARQWLRLLR